MWKFGAFQKYTILKVRYNLSKGDGYDDYWLKRNYCNQKVWSWKVGQKGHEKERKGSKITKSSVMMQRQK